MRTAVLMVRGIVHDGVGDLMNVMQSIVTMFEARTDALVYQRRRAGREFNLLHTNSSGKRGFAPPALVNSASQ